MGQVLPAGDRGALAARGREAPGRPRLPAGAHVAASLAVLIALGSGLLLLLSTGQDDAYITYWPARTLLERGEILNYNGERIEQSSSLLHTLWLALAAGALRSPVPVVGYWSAILFGALAVLRAGALSARLGLGAPRWLPFLVGSLPISLYWWFGGLETTLAAWLWLEVAIVACDLLAARSRPLALRVVAVTAAALAVRPEAFVVLLSALGAWVAADRLGRLRGGGGGAPGAGRLGGWLGLTAGLAAALALFRLAYFGQPFPQPVAAKVGGDALETLRAGLFYAVKAALLRPYALTLFAALAAAAGMLLRALARGGRGDARLFALLLVAANGAFVVTAGGDWMRGGRFFAQFAPLGLVMGAGALAGRGAPRLRAAALALAFAANAAGLLALSFGESSGRPLWRFLAGDPALVARVGDRFHWSERANRVHTRDLLFVGPLEELVERVLARSEPVEILSRQAGMVMYYVAGRYGGRIRFVDLYGLTTREATGVRAALGAGRRAAGVQVAPARLIEAVGRRREPGWRPDIVFDVYPIGADLEGLGYRIAYEQVGSEPGPALSLGPWVLPAVRYSVYQVAAVAPPWAGLLRAPRRFDWDRAREPQAAQGSPP